MACYDCIVGEQWYVKQPSVGFFALACKALDQKDDQKTDDGQPNRVK